MEVGERPLCHELFCEVLAYNREERCRRKTAEDDPVTSFGANFSGVGVADEVLAIVERCPLYLFHNIVPRPLDDRLRFVEVTGQAHDLHWFCTVEHRWLDQYSATESKRVLKNDLLTKLVVGDKTLVADGRCGVFDGGTSHQRTAMLVGIEDAVSLVHSRALHWF